MAKRTVKSAPEEELTEMEMAEQPTDEEQRAWEDEEERKREESLAPYRAVHEQQNDQDDLLAELMFEVDLLKLGLDE